VSIFATVGHGTGPTLEGGHSFGAVVNMASKTTTLYVRNAKGDETIADIVLRECWFDL
jgi:hypothetical protein